MGSAIPAPVPSAQEEVAPSEAYTQWHDEKLELCQNYFDRYDLDQSGTLNSAEELKYLTINVIKATKLDLSLAEVDKVTQPAIATIEAGGAYTLEDFMRWFHDNIKTPHDVVL